LGTTKEGAEILRRDNLKREAQEEAAIRLLHNTIAPKGTIKKRNALYKASESHLVPDNALLELREDPIIKNAMKEVKKSIGYAKDIKGFPENSIKFLDATKRFINDSSAKMRGNADRSVKLREADNYDSSAKDLTNVLDKYSDQYKEGRQLAEDVISRRKLTLKKGKDRGTVFYKQFLENNPKFEKAMSHLSRNPEAQQKMKDMRLVFERLIGHHNPKAAAGAAKSSTGTPLNRKTGDKVKVILDKLLGSTYDKEAAELITNPKWDDEITKLVKQKDKNKQATELANLLIRVGATTGTAGVSEIKR